MSDNGLRDENGALIGGLVVLDYTHGMDDFKNGVAPPDDTTPSYDLGRQRAAEQAATTNEVHAWLKRQEQETDERLKRLLSPEQYAQYRAQIDDMRKRHHAV